MTPLKKLLTGTTSLSHPQNITRMPQVIIPLLQIAGMNTFWATVTYYVAATLVTSWALNALTPSIPSGSGMQGLLANARSALAPHEYVYGQVRKGGANTYLEATGDENKFLHMIITLAGHEVEAIDDIYINDEIVSLDGNGFVTTGGWAENGLKVRIKKHLGAADQTVDTDLLAESNQITSDFKGQGIAYLYVRLEYDQDVFANGIPLFTAMVRGKKVGDPRTEQVNYSNNAALCIRDYLRSNYGLADTSTDDTIFTVAANVCDENIGLVESGTEKRYAMNGVISADTPVGSVLQSMTTSCAGMLFWGQGNWQLKVGYYTAPVKNFTLDDLRGPITLQTRTSMRDIFNVVRGTFNDAGQDYITADYPQIASATFLAEDNGVETALDLELPFTTSSATAQRIAKLTLFRGREQITFSADFGLAAFGVQVGDIVSLTNTRYGWSAKEFEVIGWKFSSSQEAGDLRINLTLHEISEAAFDWDAEETAIISNNSTLPNFATVAPVENLLLTATTILNDDGIAIPAIRATWDVSENQFVQFYEIQYKRLGGEEDWGPVDETYTAEEEWGLITAADDSEEDWGLTSEAIQSPDPEYTSVIGTTNNYVIQPVLNGYIYNVRIRAISSLGVRSPFTTAALASQGDTIPPSTPSGLSAVGTSKAITISWTNPPDLDLSYVEVWENGSNNLSTAILVGKSSSTNFYRPNLANNSQKYYWVRAVDFSENKSPFTTSVTATTLLITPNDFNDAVNALFGEAGAYGIEPVAALPTTGAFDGKLVLLLPDITIYRWDEATSSWSDQIFTASSVEAGSLTYTSFASGIEPVGVVDSLPTVAGYEGPIIVVLTTDGKLYRLVDGEWTAAVNTDDIDGQLGANLFSNGLRPVEVVGALPAVDLYQGRIVMLTTDNKMYRYTGSAWTSAVPTVDLTGQIATAQIADTAITASKIGAAAVTTAKIANEAVTNALIAVNAIDNTKIADAAITAGKIGSDAVTTAKIAAGAITEAKLGSAAVTTAKLANDAVTADIVAASAITTTKIADDSISTPKIIAGAITADTIASSAITTDKILANAITTGKIAAGAITATEISSEAVTADKILAGSVTTAKIAAGAITATEISSEAITAGKIAANAVTATEIAAGSITTAKIAAGAITATEISSEAITTAKIASGAVTATTIAAGAVTAGKIAANAVTATEIAADTITATQIAANAITASELATDSVIADKIQAGAISADKVAANAITAVKIAADAVTADKVAANAITSDNIVSNAITTAKIAAGAVNATQIATDAITADKIFAGSVTADKVATDAITANKIAASSIITSKIAAGAVTAEKITVSELSAISADLGTIEVDSAHIADAAVETLKIGANAVTVPAFANVITTYHIAYSTYSPFSPFEFPAKVTVTRTGLPTVQPALFTVNFIATAYTSWSGGVTGGGTGTQTTTARIDFQLSLKRRTISTGAITFLAAFDPVTCFGLDKGTYVFNHLDTSTTEGTFEYFISLVSFNVYSGATHLIIPEHSITYLEVRR
jgi:hypothetical protein